MTTKKQESKGLSNAEVALIALVVLLVGYYALSNPVSAAIISILLIIAIIAGLVLMIVYFIKGSALSFLFGGK